MFSSVVVFTAGRTGSHLIVRNLAKYAIVPQRVDTDTNFIHGIVHTHNPLYVPPHNDFICVISDRRNGFNAIISTLVAKRTNEFSQYTNKKIEPFLICTEEFAMTYKHFNIVYKIIDKSKYKKIVEVFYEDLIEDPTYLFAQFDIQHNTEFLTKKSPYNYYDMIINIDELMLLYEQLETRIISDEEIGFVRDTIESDLIDIRVNHNGNRLF